MLKGLAPDSWVGKPARELACWTRVVRYTILVRQAEDWISVFCEALGFMGWEWKLERTSFFQPEEWNTPTEKWEVLLPQEIFHDVGAALQICRYLAVIGEFAVTDGEWFSGNSSLWEEFHGEKWEAPSEWVDLSEGPTLKFMNG